MANKKKFTITEMIKAIQGTGGIKSIIAKRLGCSRETIANYIHRSKKIRQFYEQEIKSVGDLAEASMMKKLKNEDSDMIKFYLTTKCKGRGYTKKTEHEIINQTQDKTLQHYRSLPADTRLKMIRTLFERVSKKVDLKEFLLN